MNYFLILLILTAAVSAQTNRPSDRVALEPCEMQTGRDTKEKVLCGTHHVWENRDRAVGRKIPIKIVVFPAKSTDKAPDPLFYIPGGPGSSATEEAPFVAQQFAKTRERHDLVFVDQRGTGGSNLLFCELFDPKNIHSYLGHWNPPERVRECRKELEKQADLKLYTTPIAMDDLNEVRKALGYEKINLAGSSYGTRAVLAYVRQHGSSVRSIHLQGVSPLDHFMPGDYPWQTERALQGVLDECLADVACRTAFPNIKEETHSVLAVLKKGPVKVNVSVENKPVDVMLARDLAAEAVRYMLYQTGAAGRIPLTLHEASRGNFKLLAEAAIRFRKMIVATGATGQYLTVTCAEDVPFAKQKAGRDAENTFLGSYRLREQMESCAKWPRASIPKGYSEPVASNVPTLIYTGQWDPVTPPEYGDKTAKLLPNSLHIVVPGGGHGFGGMDGLACLSNITHQFIESGSVKGLDTACVGSIKRRGFTLK